MVATKAFGMGVDKNNIRHVSVPESIVSWAQELGRAGRDGSASTATILFQKSDVSHANANLTDRARCNRILSNCWRFVEAHTAGENYYLSSLESPVILLYQILLAVMFAALQIKISPLCHLMKKYEGSSATGTQAYDKKLFSYGNNRGHSFKQWRLETVYAPV